MNEIFKPKHFFDANEIDRIKYKYSLPERYLLFVGRLNVRKNVDNLLRAIPLLKNSEIKLLIVGSEDWKTSNYSQLVYELGIENRVQFKGAIYNDDLSVIFSLATVFCFPSLAESFGLPALEAMASGVPVVVSNSTALPEICGKAGNYVNPIDFNDIAAVIDNLLHNPAYSELKSKQSVERANYFSWHKSAEQILNCLYQC